MSLTVDINDLSLAHKGSNGTATATLPDACKTPSPGGPVPLPYPNIAVSSDLAMGTVTIKVDGGNSAAHRPSVLSRSTGDEAGSAGGVFSSTFIKEASWLLFSFDVMLEGENACRLTDKLFMNHMNTVCLAGWIQEFLKKNRGKSKADACLALFELIMEMLEGGDKQKHWKGRPLEGPNGRFNQNTQGGGLGPRGNPHALPKNHPPLPPEYPGPTNDWETHDIEIKKQQDLLEEQLKELDDECGGGSRKQQKDLDRAREAAKRKRPQKEDWTGDPPPAPESPPLSDGQKAIVAVAVVLVVGGIAAAFFTGGASLVATGAGIAMLVGAGAVSGSSPSPTSA